MTAEKRKRQKYTDDFKREAVALVPIKVPEGLQLNHSPLIISCERKVEKIYLSLFPLIFSGLYVNLSNRFGE